MHSLINAVQSDFDIPHANANINASVAAVISNNPDAPGLDTARQAGIATEVVDHRKFSGRDSFDKELSRIIEANAADWVLLAGFMRILGDTFVNHYRGKLINIHPSLLPDYPGLNTHQRALDAGDKYAGASVHYVTEQLDGGPVILNARVAIEEQDDENSLARRVLEKEHIIYPLALSWVLQQQVRLKTDASGCDYCEWQGERRLRPIPLHDLPESANVADFTQS